MATPLLRRAGWNPAPMTPMPPVPGNSSVIPSMQVPGAGQVTEQPSAQPGILPTTAATPMYDPAATPAYSAQPVGAEGWQGALQRALIGFSRGASHANIDPTYNPIAAGLVGGTESIGAAQNDALNRRMQIQAMQQQPFLAAQAAALKTNAEQAAMAPWKSKENQDTFNRELALHTANNKADAAPELIEPLAQALKDEPASIRSLELARMGGYPRMALSIRLNELDKEREATGKPIVMGLQAQREQQYQAGKSGAQAAATYQETTAQPSARAANTVQMLLPDLRSASAAYARPEIRAANGILNWVDNQTGNTKAQTWQQYLLEAKTKASTALQSGGVPQQEAQARIDKIMPDTMGPEQANAAADALQAIMQTQKQGALTRVAPPSTGGTLAPTAPAAPAKKSTWRHY